MRNRFFPAVAVILCLLPGNLAWGQANLPNNPNAATVQGPDPTGMLGYPLATVPATGAQPWTTVPVRSLNSFTVTNVGDTADVDCSAATMVQVRLKGQAVAGNVVYQFEQSIDGIDYYPVLMELVVQNGVSTVPSAGQGFAGTAATNAVVQGSIASASHFRVRLTSNPGGAVLPVVIATFSTAGAVTVTHGTIQSYPFAQAGNATVLDGQATPTQPDTILGAFILAPSLGYVFQGNTGSETRVRAVRGPAVFRVVSTAVLGNTALWTPAAGLRFRLMRWRYTVTGSATTAGGADIVVKLFDGAAGVTGQQDTVTVPAAATTLQGQLATSPWIDLGNGYLSSAANNVLNINLSAALSAGTVTVEAVGTEE